MMRMYVSCIAALMIAVMVAGCGGGSGLRFSDLFDESAAAEGTGIQGFGLVRAVVILATHEATARQRQVAEQNGRRAVAQITSRLAAQEKTTAREKKSVASTAKSETEAAPAKKKSSQRTAEAVPTPESRPEEEPEPSTKLTSRADLPRIIAVATEKNDKTDEKAAQAVMLFDTYSQEIVGNKVYDIESEPEKGAEVRFETYSSIYVGASL